MKYVITLDVGTSSMRAIVYDEFGKDYFTSTREYHSEFIYPSKVEQDAITWSKSAIDVLKETAYFINSNSIKVEAISITSQRSSLIPVDKEGTPLDKAIMWQDKRTIKECEEILENVTMMDIYAKTGLRVNPYFVLPRMLWLKKNKLEIFNKAYKLLGVQDYVLCYLTGEFKTDWSQAARTMLMDINDFKWNDEMMKLASINEDKLCQLISPGSIGGYITERISRITGLIQGLPVIVAGGDQQNAAIALNVIAPGRAEANTGTGSFIIAHADKPIFDSKCRIICSSSAIAGKWILEASIFNTGSIYRWFKEQYFRDIINEKSPYDIMNKEAEESPIGSNGVIMLPHFEGSAAPYWEPKAKGLFFNLSLGTKRGDVARAILEGIAMEISENIELLESKISTIDQVSIAGGMAKSDLFAQIQANAFDKNVIRYENSEATSLGATINAMVTLGVYSSVEESFNFIIKSKASDVFKPDEVVSKIYKKIIDRKRKLFYSLQEGNVYNSFMDTLL